jgi:hypothetical protein
LSYAADQLKKSNEWITSTWRLRLAKHEFPWRKIDDSNIETEGFIRDAFEFTIDQAKILDLLTGHTLYNDTRVVLRELVQNAIDAIRIKHYAEKGGTERPSYNSHLQPITERVHGEQMPRLAGNVFDLLSQLHNQLIEGARGAVVVDAPDFVQERFARNRVAAFAEEDWQDV